MTSSTKHTRRYRSSARRHPEIQAAARSLGQRIRALRRERGLSQEVLAERAGLDWKHLQVIEAGRTNTTLASLVGVARGLGVSLAELFQGVGGLASRSR